jgi:4'-phosphopantetheinyl transferase
MTNDFFLVAGQNRSFVMGQTAKMYLIENWATGAHPLTLNSGELHLWRIELDAPTDTPVNLLTPDELERADRMLDPQGQQHFIRARSALRAILGKYLNQPPGELAFGYGEHGKPFIQDLATDLHFNLSHSHELALLAVTRQAEVGIDLERLQARPNLQAIAHRLFDVTIQQELAQLEGDALTEAFYRHWTAHEATIKTLGSGIFQADATGKDCPPEVMNFIPKEGWLAAVATSTQLPPPSTWKTLEYSIPTN